MLENTNLDPQRDGRDFMSQAGHPAECMKNMSIAHGKGAICQGVNIGYRWWQAGKKPPDKQKMVVHC